MTTEIETRLRSAGVVIKPLVWIEDWIATPNHAISAWSGFHRYVIEMVFTGMNSAIYRLRGIGNYASQDLAFAAAWDHYVGCIAAMFEVVME